MTVTSIVWFRRDLRLHDNPAVQRAAQAGNRVLPIFVIDPALVRPSGEVRLAFMYRSLRELDAALDGRLVVRLGDPERVVGEIAREVGAAEVVVSRDYAPYGRARDARVAAALRADGAELIGSGSPYAVPPGAVVKTDGSPYSVFTPFFRAWSAKGWADPSERADIEWCAARSVRTDDIPTDPFVAAELPPAGEDAAHRRWAEFLEDGIARYATDRNTPAEPGTSRLSPYLRWGQLHPRQLLADLHRAGHDSAGAETFRKELGWREFYADVLFHRPESAREDLQKRIGAIITDTDAAARVRFDRWAAGTTGFGIVDAGMRQLLATGWMHNRVRMITASFLVKDLHLPWQWGARHFMRHLVDGDLASNQHGWQWTAGTGTDAAPYFRVLNPTLQSERFDPSGEYIRRWVPERRDVQGAAIHRPRDPIVDHAVERAEALQRYAAASGRYPR